MAPAEVITRRFAWEDLEALALLMVEISPTDEAALSRVLEQTRRLYRQPGLQAERDCFLAWCGPELVGYLFMTAEERIGCGVVSGGVHPLRRRRGVGRRLLQRVTAHARGLHFQVLHVEVASDSREASGLLRSVGFSRVCEYWYLRRDSGEPCHVAASPGYRLRLMQPAEVEALTTLQNETFAGSWGYCPNTPEEIRYRVFDLPSEGPDEVVLLRRGTEMAGYCWVHRDASGTVGVVGMTGVHPAFRGKSLGRLVVGAGVDHLLRQGVSAVELTVNSENTPALRVYEGLGFRLQRVSHWYELRLD